MRFAIGFLTAVLAVGVCGAGTVGEQRKQGRFENRVLHRAGGTIATAPKDVTGLAPGDSLGQKWSAFRERHAGRWNVYLDERSGMPTLVTGRGIEWYSPEALDEVTLDSLEAAARSFLGEHESLLGKPSPRIVRDDRASAELRKGYWQLVFRLQVDSVLVENARLNFRVDQGRLTMFGASNWVEPTINGIPSIEADKAREILDAYLDFESREFEYATDPELVLVAIDAAPGGGRPRAWSGQRGKGLSHSLVWRLTIREGAGPESWIGDVDAHDGQVRSFVDGTHYASIAGGVFPEHPEGDCPTGGCELAEFPMPFADWTESGQPGAVADTYGNFSCLDPQAEFETTLIGRYVAVDDTCGEISEVAGCDDSVQLGLKYGENCDTAPGSSPGNTAAARSAYYHVNRVAEVARYYNPGNGWLNGQVTVNSNWASSFCNASYGGGEIYVYRSGGGCSNSGEIQGIVAHEWGHGYDQNDGGDWDNTSEAYGDLVSLLASRQSCFGKSLAPPGNTCSGYGDSCLTCTGFRDHDYTARQANTPATPQVFVEDNCGEGQGPCGRQVHCETYPIVESMFDLATRDLPASGMDQDSAWQLVERLWYSSRAGSGGDIYTCALPSSDSCAVGSWYQQLRAADDDDADLSNGTPHAAELYAAFARHNIACGSAGDADNQSVTSCPALATPALTVSAAGTATELDWDPVADASEFVVYRGDLGCQRQQVAVATLSAGTTNWLDTVGDPNVTRYYRVEAVGVNPVCRSAVSNCEATPNGPRLQKNAHQLIEGTNSNGDGRLDPGETVTLPVTLFNGGNLDALDVSSRLRTVDPVQGRVIEPVADWADIAVDAELESGAPHFEMTLFDYGVACGETVDLELEMHAAGAEPRTSSFSFVLGEKSRDYPVSAGLAMSRFDTNPLLSTLEMTDTTVIGDLDVAVNIDHTVPGDLIVELSSPSGTTVRLHDLSPGTGGIVTRYDLLTDPDGPGTMADFEGEPTAGTWTLSVQNTVFGGGSGTFIGWTLHVTSAGAFDCTVYPCTESTPDQSPDGLLVDWTIDGGDGSRDLALSWNGVSGVAGYHVLQSTAPTFDGIVDLTGRTDGPLSLLVEDGVAITPSLTFLQVRAVNACNQESP